MDLDLGFGRGMRWAFVVADVSRAIIGTDILSYFHLIIDVRRQVLIDGHSHVEVCAHSEYSDFPTIRRVSADGPYRKLLAEFPGLQRASATPTGSAHNVEHHIETTGPPLTAKARRLAPEKFKAAKEQFTQMIKQGICRPSKSPWASPLHLVLKKNQEWRPCGRCVFPTRSEDLFHD
nr:PREDICTED: uncharacterized protein LOC105664217 [Megachile rotundata]